MDLVRTGQPTGYLQLQSWWCFALQLSIAIAHFSVNGAGKGCWTSSTRPLDGSLRVAKSVRNDLLRKYLRKEDTSAPPWQHRPVDLEQVTPETSRSPPGSDSMTLQYCISAYFMETTRAGKTALMFRMFNI